MARFSVVRGEGRGWLLLSVAVGWFVVLGLRFVVPALLPQIKGAFGVSNATAGVAVTLIWATYALAQFPAGALVDRIGERRLLTVSLVFTGLGFVVFALSPVFTAFLVGCVVFGLGTGIFGPSRGVVLSNSFGEGRELAFGITLALGSLGSAVFPVVTSLFVGRYGWRWVVAGIVPVTLVVGVLIWWAVPDRTPPADKRDEPLHQALIRAVTDRRVAVGTITAALMLFTYEGLTAFLPSYLIATKGLSQTMASALFALMFLAGAGFQFISDRVVEYIGSKATLIGIAIIGTVALVALPFVSGIIPLAILVIILSTRIAFAPVNNSYVLTHLPDEIQGTAWGFVRTSFFLVASTGSTFVGWAADRGRFDGAFLALAGVTGVAAVLYLLLPGE